jgi:hypothetical protein
MSWADRWLFAEAAIWLAVARLAISILPFRRLAKHLGEQHAESPVEDETAAVLSGRVSRAVRIMRRHVPWDSHCLAQAIAAQQMLRCRGVRSTLYLGVAKDGQTDLKAHAWLRCGRVLVVGGPGQQHYAVVSTFAHPDRGKR